MTLIVWAVELKCMWNSIFITAIKHRKKSLNVHQEGFSFVRYTSVYYNHEIANVIRHGERTVDIERKIRHVFLAENIRSRSFCRSNNIDRGDRDTSQRLSYIVFAKGYTLGLSSA